MRQLPYSFYILAFSLLLIIITTACISNLDPRYFNSEYSYEIGVTHNGPLSNATFIIPLPVKENVPRLASDIYTESDFSFENVTVLLTQSPLGLDLSNATSITGYEPWFLVIRIDSPVTDSSPYFIFHFKKTNRVKLENPDFRVDTLSPIGNETLITPKFEFVRPKSPAVTKKSLDRVVYLTTTTPYSTPIFIDYSAPPSTHVEVYCNVRGTNYWREYYDAGGSNQYQDRYSKIISGDAHGWYMAKGELIIADGFYPNLDHPEWQKFLNQTPVK